VMEYRLPLSAKKSRFSIPDSDEFNDSRIGLQWQWNANPKSNWAFPFPAEGVLRLNAVLQPDSVVNLLGVPNLLLQKFPAAKFKVISKLSFTPKTNGESVGLLVMGTSYAGLCLMKKDDGLYLAYTICKAADKGNAPTTTIITTVQGKDIYLSFSVNDNAVCTFSYSTDGATFTKAGDAFTAAPGKWIGAKFGFFCTRNKLTNDAGFADIDWIRIEK